MRVAILGCGNSSIAALRALRCIAPHSEVLVFDVDAKRVVKCIEFGFGHVEIVNFSRLSLERVDVAIDSGELDLRTLPIVKPRIGFVSPRSGLHLEGLSSVNILSIAKALATRVKEVLGLRVDVVEIRGPLGSLANYIAQRIIEEGALCSDGGVSITMDSLNIVIKGVECDVVKGLKRLVELGVLTHVQGIEILGKYLAKSANDDVTLLRVVGRGRAKVSFHVSGKSAALEECLMGVAIEALIDGYRGSLDKLLSTEGLFAKALSRFIARGIDVSIGVELE